MTPSDRLKRGFSTLFLLSSMTWTFFGPTSLEAVRNKYSYEEDKSVVLREILDGLEELRHEVRNHETEIRTFEEKFKNQEDILDSVRQQTADSIKVVKEALKNQTAAVEARISGHDSTSKGLSSDLRNQAQESAAILADYKARILDLEKSLEVQNRNIDNLQHAVRALAEVMQTKDSEPLAAASTVSTAGARTYRVKSGDSLGTIAKQNGTTVKRLKELNNLTGDQIMIGQKLTLPE